MLKYIYLFIVFACTIARFLFGVASIALPIVVLGFLCQFRFSACAFSLLAWGIAVGAWFASGWVKRRWHKCVMSSERLGNLDLKASHMFDNGIPGEIHGTVVLYVFAIIVIAIIELLRR